MINNEKNDDIWDRQNTVLKIEAIYAILYGLGIHFCEPSGSISGTIVSIASIILGFVFWFTRNVENHNFRRTVCQIQCINHLLRILVFVPILLLTYSGDNEKLIRLILCLGPSGYIFFKYFPFAFAEEVEEESESNDKDIDDSVIKCDYAILIDQSDNDQSEPV